MVCDVCYGCWGHVPHAVQFAALYCGGRGGRVLFARGTRVMRHVLEPRALRAVSCAACAGRRDGREACAAVGTVMCRVLLVRGRCVMYAGGCVLCSRRWRACDVCSSACWRPWRVSSVCWRCWN